MLERFKPPYSLKTILLCAVAGTLLVMAGVFSMLTSSNAPVAVMLMAVGLALIGLRWVLERLLGPVETLSSFAQELPRNIGQRIDLPTYSLEAHQLALAMNQASQNIFEQVSQVQAIVNTAPDAIMGLNKNGLVMSANPACSSLFGRDEAHIQGLSVEACIPGLNAQRLDGFFGQVHRDYGRPLRIVRQDFFGTRADGTLFPVQISLGEVKDNARLSYACIVRDMTDERATQESSELYERALASSHNAVFIINAKMSSQPIVFVNEAFRQVFDLKPHQVLGRNLEQLTVEQSHNEGFVELNAAIREQRNTSATITLVLSDAREIIAKVSLSLVMSAGNDLTHFVGIVSDVTAHIRAEKAIAERSAQLDTIFSLSPDGFVLFDDRERLMFANPAFERMTGRTWMSVSDPLSLELFESALGGLCHHDHPMGLIAQWGEGGDPSHSRVQLARPQHRVLRAELRRSLVGRGETILYFRDITHEDEVDRMKSEFLASAAHELRTPMVSIFGFTELLLRRKFKEDRQADMLETIHRQSGLLVKMINELLDLARIESRRGLDLDISAHSLQELVHNSVKGLMRADQDRQVTLLEIPEVQVLIDPEKMQLALSNLLSNAFKYSPQGGEVSLSARLQTDGDQCFAVLEVQDHGIGMKQDQVSRAFERFYRADTTGNIPGTGLGLSLVKEIAELHNGRAELVSEPGQGTLARLYVPIDKSTMGLTLVA